MHLYQALNIEFGDELKWGVWPTVAPSNTTAWLEQG
jgi:hypothetical protein